MKISSVALAFLLLFSMPSKAQSSADEILKEACQLAATGNKNVLIMFHASWCGWCHRMENSINDESCKKFFDDNYVIRYLVVDESDDKKNLENPGADDLRKKYHGEGQGIPFWLLFDKNGQLLADSKMRAGGEGPGSGQNIGCPANEMEVNYFISLLKKTSKLDSPQLEIIKKRFRQNGQ